MTFLKILLFLEKKSKFKNIEFGLKLIKYFISYHRIRLQN